MNKHLQNPDDDPNIRLYVLVNNSLPPINAGIQALHAVSEFVWYNRDKSYVKEWVEDHKTVVLLSATVEEMRNMITYFISTKRMYQDFYEPDIGNILTAIAFEPLPAVEGKKIFSKFNLYK